MSENKTILTKVRIREIVEDLTESGQLPLIECNMLRSYNGSLLNRDFNGRAKIATFGGIPRVFLSSASGKHAERKKMYEEVGTRSRSFPYQVFKELINRGKDEEYIKQVRASLGKIDEKDETKSKPLGLLTEQLMNFGPSDVETVASVIIDTVPDDFLSKKVKEKKDIKTLLKKNLKNAVETTRIDPVTCLMGRMSTEDYIDTVQSALHTSIDISIDAYQDESNDFVAIDYDRKKFMNEPDFVNFFEQEPEEWQNKNNHTTGSSMMDREDVCANTFYSYASISVRTLVENLLRGREDSKESIDKVLKEAADIVTGYLKDHMTLVRGAKQSSFATYPRPLVTLITVGTQVQPMSAEGSAFEKVIYAEGEKSVGEKGVEKLAEFWERTADGIYTDDTEYQAAFWLSENYANLAPSNAKAANYKTMKFAITAIITGEKS